MEVLGCHVTVPYLWQPHPSRYVACSLPQRGLGSVRGPVGSAHSLQLFCRPVFPAASPHLYYTPVHNLHTRKCVLV